MDKIIWPYYIWVYFDILKKLNLNYKKLNKLVGKESNRKREKLYYDMFEEITQLIPYSVSSGKIQINNDKGILELLNGEESFVEECFREMSVSESKWLYYIKQTRNNIEHSPHRILICALYGTNDYSKIVLNYSKKGADLKNIELDEIEYCYCDSAILNRIIKKLNVLFIKIRKDINQMAKNKIIDSELIKIYAKYRFN